ncbi:DNA polymerase III subunit alpha [Bacillus sp. DTU_2020_1000418_1_SI_GHA_SEK_038]|uniref:DNA polymerase III subunit alpha n=1 Tax=Bacillus sp. DTU_2020_1000418_1_SI_GHA_SEK_038 TaxID=3077585 RepID=UPI0028EB9561|nr:DNA polymerase III subunit alpha [Bacillus sp. DTU_2020_1000418_1_SI_GHA_SEK_038]WNS74571.1 DNA polymerase III subunit alpha [Bacillus sp. DTU_2020_1000418_1_SI_GHA_SEK_038]
MSFIHLHVYSAYSLLTSTAAVEQLVKDARQKGFSALALTDRNVMYGAVAFYKECLKQSIKPILGLTVDVVSELKPSLSYPIVLLAKNQIGFQNLLKITSVVQTKSLEGIPAKWLKAYSEGLIGISPGVEGEIEHYLATDEYENAIEAASIYKELFGESDFYLSFQNHGLAEETKIHPSLVRFSKETGIELAATNQVYYLSKEDAFAQECLMAIKNGEKLQDETREQLKNDEYYLKTAEEMAELLAEYPDALENTLKIADQCNVMIELNGQHLPKYPVEDNLSADELLEAVCLKGLNERYTNVSDEHKQRLAYELQIIKRMKFSDYFLIVWDFMRFSRENGILTGPGRGSAAGSIVAYVLYITDADPIEHKLLFERFLNPERISMPDIDIDFPDHRRDEVIKYVSQKYGELHVAQIITFGTLAAKAALRDVGRAFGLNPKELDSLSKRIPSKLGISLKDAYKESEPLRRFVSESSLNQRLFETALKLEGLPRHTSTHAAGVVISEKPLVNVIPIQNGHDGVYLTQYSMEHLEEIGLLKMDFLGLRNLSLIENILMSIQKKTGQRINIKAIPLDDSSTFELLSKGETTGIFQLESEGMRKVLKKLRPSSFEDIVAVNALYRPGPMENIPLFIDRKHGKQKVTYPHTDLIPILENTYGVIVYQEQIMQIAAKLAGFTLGEADLLRRAVSKKQKEVLDRERTHFVNGALKNGYDEKTANDIYDLIVRFANYGFNRSHAVAYSFISYQLAYLKTHFPLHFMAALLTSVIGNEEKISQYVRELKQMNLKILPPSINTSGYSFLVEKDAIRYSLAAIKGIGASALKEIFRSRKNKRFDDLFDFSIRVTAKAINRKILEALVHSGSFDEFGQDRAVLLASLDPAVEHANLLKIEDEQIDFFSEGDFFPKPKYTQVDPIRSEDKLAFEKEVLGVYLSDHPVAAYEIHLPMLNAFQLYQLQGSTNRVRAVVYLANVKKIRTKKNLAMAFLTISDQTDEMEAVVFPDTYSKFSVFLKQGNILFIEGKLEEKDGKRQFIVQACDEVHAAIEREEKKDPVLYLKITKENENPDTLHYLKKLFNENEGKVQIILYYESTKKRIRLGEEDLVNPTEEFIIKLKGILGDQHVILKK